MALPERMKFGIFMGPFHRVGENPTLALDRDLELVQWLDFLGYDEAWIGEHHSAGWETISSPEIFIGVAADLRRPDHERWRQVYALSELKGKRITVEVSRDRVAINVQ